MASRLWCNWISSTWLPASWTVADLRGLFGRHAPQARQTLRKLLVSKLVFARKTDEDGRAYTFTGRGVLDPILAGTVDAKAMASPMESRVVRTIEFQGVAPEA